MIGLRRQKGWAACSWAAGVMLACAAAPAQVEVYEGTVFPEQAGWQRLPDGPAQGERRLEDGWFIQTVRLPDGWPEPTGESNFYRKDIDRFVGVDGFFVEWRALTDNPPWLIDEWKIPTVVTAAGKAESLYHTVMTESAVALLRDVTIPRVIASVLSGSPHIYRVEVYSDAYLWYIDGVLIDIGTPEGVYPDANARLSWGARREHVDATTAWDYVRVGRIPDTASGDYDSDRTALYIDYYFVHDCLTKDGPGIFAGPGNDAGPGCRFTDFDFDGDVDLRDFAEFQIIFLGVECEPFCPGPQ